MFCKTMKDQYVTNEIGDKPDLRGAQGKIKIKKYKQESDKNISHITPLIISSY